ncbi:hypothetical protein DYB34_006389 [Aphanomyces astaci]|uniref:Uncharacterized protein n=1 Tax=Aphanomyces astaci TaxID=112090 RepID=A0A3R6ZU04_APHAT|nr:hypothetical protein DYB34_006389 [Aphanomyces astaci]
MVIPGFTIYTNNIMKTTSFALVAYVAAAVNAQTTNSPTTTSTNCPTKLDPSNALVKTTGLPPDLVSELPSSWVGCLGTLNENTITADVTATFLAQPTCLAAAPYLIQLTKAFQSPTGGDLAPKNGNSTKDDDNIKVSSSYESYFLSFPDSDVQKICTPLTKSVPCLKAGILPAIFKQINSNPCCSAMVAEVKALTGETPDVLLANLVEKATDVVCTIQTPGFNGAANQTCGFSWVKSFTRGNTNTSDASVVALTGRGLTALQIPNDQGCAAVNGNSFTSTTGAAVTTLFVKPNVPGSCAKPADALLSWVRKFPVLTNATYSSIRLLDLFEDGKCVKGSLIANAVDIDDHIYRDFGVSKANFNASCFHLSNGAFQTCAFSDSIPQNSTPAATSAANRVAVVSMVASSVALLSLAW